MTIRARLFRIALQSLAVTLGFAAVQAGAQPAYPTKVIRLVNPNQPGGNSDILFRLLSGKMGSVGNTPEQHAAYIKTEIGKWRKVAQGAGIKPE